MKKILLAALIMAIAFVFSCKDDDGGNPEQPQEHAPQTINFGEGLSTTVTAPAMTATQWNNVIGKLTEALDAAAKDNGDLGEFTGIAFGMTTFNIDLVKNPDEGYQYYKTDAANSKFLLNADYVIGATQIDLSAKVATAINAMWGVVGIPQQE